jgi:excisionase family DNA binding protein
MEPSRAELQKLKKEFSILRRELADLRAYLTTPAGPPPDYLTSEEAARFLRISKGTLYTYTNRGTITAHRPPGARRLMYARRELESYLETRQKRTPAEPIKKAQATTPAPL